MRCVIYEFGMRESTISAVRFTKSFADSAPSKAGVYVFWRVTAIGTFHAIYVGMSNVSVRARLVKHFEGSHNDELALHIRGSRAELLCCWRITSASRAKALESYLIRTLKPRANLSENG